MFDNTLRNDMVGWLQFEVRLDKQVFSWNFEKFGSNNWDFFAIN